MVSSMHCACIVYTLLADQGSNCISTDSCLAPAYQQECFFGHKALLHLTCHGV